MILSAIFHFFKAVFGFVIKAIAWLLVSLSLWVPLLYSLVFLIACGATGASLTAHRTWFFVGLALSFIVSFAISNFIYERKARAKKKEKKSSGNIEKVRASEVPVSISAPASVPAAEISPLAAEESSQQSYEEGAGESSIVRQAKEDALRSKKKSEPKQRDETASKHGFIGYGDMNGEPFKNSAEQEGWSPVSGQYNQQSGQFGQFQQPNQNSPQSGRFSQQGQNNPQYNQYNQQSNEYRQQNNYQGYSNENLGYGNVSNPGYGSRGNKYGEVEFESYDLHRGEDGAVVGGRGDFSPDSGRGGGEQYESQSQNAYKTTPQGFDEDGFSPRGRGFNQGASAFNQGAGGFESTQPEQAQGFEGSQRRFDRRQLAAEKVNDYSAGFNQAGFNQNEGFRQADNYSNSENYTPPENYSQNQSEHYGREGFGPAAFGGAWQAGNAQSGPGRGSAVDEQPNIFATRHDPTVFIYEYSNRLDYYKRTKSGMIFMYSRPKTAG